MFSCHTGYEVNDSSATFEAPSDPANDSLDDEEPHQSTPNVSANTAVNMKSKCNLFWYFSKTKIFRFISCHTQYIFGNILKLLFT